MDDYYLTIDITIWKYIYIDGAKTKYMVSNHGQVKNTKRNKYLSDRTHDKDGYVQICLSHKNKHYAMRRCRLVAMAFIPNPENKPQVNHKDKNVTNDDVMNLEWVTAKENRIHALVTGNGCKIIKGEEHPNSIYTNDQIIKVCELLVDNKHTVRQISYLTQVNPQTVKDVLNKKGWTHISSNYDLSNYNCYGKEIYKKELIFMVNQYIGKGYRNIDIIRCLGLPETKKSDAFIRYYRKRYKDNICSTTIENIA